ncbi:Pre-mRNA-splicing factor prp1 [Colletotrichum fructicola]|uniref:Pre-mRNA-splicing factor prp1 n=1 Tax=Colletotrichum fructicola (strain Nara gc5) TaxID=1213859 RepID=L2FLR1_COLFN|nr:Pre-mRNA-splicing factor [Colletotrichum fructicola]XP_036489126.1 Pre-mRNA-splicing factor prp1 [Colletotrichum siamense]KAF4486408.1 Pre-mRNA-splicing factor prp1 [Colletotrichum fructicola Nara gc5]KAF4827089.1 Pre-mRNA-splicing factor prp1 [Colletotrichum tropicale]KAI8232400.1 Pre-mRNA-splicing factor prp1 [Colletotrichum sp. SAR 10_96]KAI8273641.1 Pre-mRNA-splicing factor prp1 [Colletotrichum sp. SAR 10_98]KAI8280373.1 Pre-mRNA-splicing factor prp1 [Colletotrichum sp. SAR11_57]KAJ50
MASRRDFLSQPAPENYVAGLGRGATGFTTRSDLGPAREGPSEDQIKEAVAKRAAQLGIGADGKKQEADDDNDDDRFKDPDNEVGLFAGGVYDKDDEEADRIWKEVDEKMAKRRQKQREAREKAEQEEYERKNPKIQQQFADLKRALSTVSDEEWANLPEVGDLTGKNRRSKQMRQQRFYAVPDSVLAGASAQGELGTTISDDGAAASSEAADGTMTNFAKIGAARDKVLKSKLEQASLDGTESSVGGSATSIDPKGYITSLQKSGLTEAQAQVGDINRVRELLTSVIKTNPNNAPGWIAAARLEELAGKTVAARNVIARGCTNCPKSEDVWLENIRLNEGRNAKIIAADAIKKNERSVRLWVEAMRLENEPRAKKRVIRLALDHIPESEALWKEAVNLEEDPEDARLLLAKATELIPLSVDLWLALARLESPENAQKVLNRARKAVPTSHEIWIAAARLQEQLGTGQKVNVMKRAVAVLVKESAMPKREEWIGEAEKCEDEGAIITCGNIIQETLGYGLDEDDDRKETWMEDAKSSINRGMYETARAIYSYALRVFVNSKTLWMAAADLERNHGTKESLAQVLEKAVEACPKSEVLWMMLAKEKWQAGEVDNARLVLARAFKSNPDNEDIWLAAVKLEAENGETERARKLLEEAREQAPTDRVWMKSVVFERVLGNSEAALDLAQRALQYFPGAAKLWMLKGQIYEDLGKIGQARESYSTGVKAVPKSIPLWLLYSRLEENAGLVVKARSVLDRARLAVPKSPELWCESVRIERRAGNINQAKSLMAKALQEVPKSGLLWSEQIWHLEPRTQRKPRSLEAIKKVDNDPILFVAVARIFWGERKLEKAQNWFEKALVLDSDNGDSWAWYYKFLLQHGTDEKRADVINKCVLNEPRHGEHWQAIAKHPQNARKETEEILKLVADRIEK